MNSEGQPNAIPLNTETTPTTVNQTGANFNYVPPSSHVLSEDENDYQTHRDDADAGHDSDSELGENYEFENTQTTENQTGVHSETPANFPNKNDMDYDPQFKWDNESAGYDDDDMEDVEGDDDAASERDDVTYTIGYVCHRTAPTFQSAPYMVVKTEEGEKFRIDISKDDTQKYRIFSPIRFYYHNNINYQAYVRTPRFVQQQRVFDDLLMGYEPLQLNTEEAILAPPNQRCWIKGTATTATTRNNNTVLAIKIEDEDFPYKLMFVYQDNLKSKFPAEGESITFATTVRTTGKKGHEQWNAVTYVKAHIDRQAILRKLTHILPPPPSMRSHHRTQYGAFLHLLVTPPPQEEGPWNIRFSNQPTNPHLTRATPLSPSLPKCLTLCTTTLLRQQRTQQRPDTTRNAR